MTCVNKIKDQFGNQTLSILGWILKELMENNELVRISQHVLK